MLTQDAAAALLDSLIEAYLEVGSVLTGDKITRQADETVPYPGLPHTAGLLAAYAWNGEWDSSSGDVSEALHELSTATELIGGSLMLPDGTDLFPREQKAELHRLAKAATARDNLDAGDAITIEQLAALAGVAEKTVRTATNPKSTNPIAITKQGHWTWIEAGEALTWLSRRTGFKPTQATEAGANQSIPVDLPSLISSCESWLARAELDAATLAKHLAWPQAKALALGALLARKPDAAFADLDPAALHQFAKAVGMALPDDFARQAYRLLALAHADALVETQLHATR